jgi:hypothetical protein
MIAMRSAIAAGATAILLAPTPNLRADDTVRLLAGSGSLQNAATLNLKGTGADADTRAICYWRRAWRYGYGESMYPPIAYAPPVYYPPTHYPPATTAPPVAPMTSYQPQAPIAPEVVGVAPHAYPSARPTIVVGYQGRFFGGSIAIRPGARLTGSAPPAEPPIELTPTPQPNDTFRYDGGPSRPVPMPVPDPVPPTDPVPTTVPALHRVLFERSRPVVTYPGYGEKPAKRPVAVDPVMVKKTTNP